MLLTESPNELYFEGNDGLIELQVEWTAMAENYYTWNSYRILTESQPKCTNHFGKDWTINSAEIIHKNLYLFVNIVKRHLYL